jgi:hypothetical protein
MSKIRLEINSPEQKKNNRDKNKGVKEVKLERAVDRAKEIIKNVACCFV